MDWARSDCKIALDARYVVVRTGAPGKLIDEVAADVEADLVVIGRSGCGRIVRELAGRHHVLAAARPRRSKEIVAATDLRDPRLPVVRCAECIAEACGGQLTIFHKPEPAISLAARGGRIEPLSVTAERSAPAAIVRLARERDADIIAVGVRKGHGTTLDAVLDESNRSILAAPLP
jgi:nucleotide-binding universal stress UspA family protein